MATFKSTDRYETVTMTSNSFFPGAYTIPVGTGYYNIVVVQDIIHPYSRWIQATLNFDPGLGVQGQKDRDVQQILGGMQDLISMSLDQNDDIAKNIRDRSNPGQNTLSYFEWSSEKPPEQGVPYPLQLKAVIRYWELVQ